MGKSGRNMHQQPGALLPGLQYDIVCQTIKYMKVWGL